MYTKAAWRNFLTRSGGQRSCGPSPVRFAWSSAEVESTSYIPSSPRSVRAWSMTSGVMIRIARSPA